MIVDLGGGNSGIQQTDAGSDYAEFYLTVSDTSNTLAVRFRVDSSDYSGPIDVMTLLAGGSVGSPDIGLGIRDVAGVPTWCWCGSLKVPRS